MWVPTKTETVEMYARFWVSRYGYSASTSARKMAASLKNKGDLGGYKAWNEVADVIDRRKQNEHRAIHQEDVVAAL